MNGSQSDGSGNGTQDAERRRRLRLGEFLRELVRQEGRMEAAELLGVNYKTLVRAEESGQMTGRMSDALERLLGTTDDPELGRQRERMGAMEERMAGLEDGMTALRRELRSGLAGQRTAGAGQAGGAGGKPGRGGGGGGTGATLRLRRNRVTRKGRSGRRPGPPLRLRGCARRSGRACGRLDPEVVTEEPDDDEAV